MNTFMIQMISSLLCASVTETTCLSPLHCSYVFETEFPRAKNGLFFASLTSSIGHKASIQTFAHKCIMVVTCLVEHKWVIAPQSVTSELPDNTKKLVLN